jgi:hypothetical protein
MLRSWRLPEQRGILKKFYNLCLTSNQIWLINGVHACQSTYLTKLKKKKKSLAFLKPLGSFYVLFTPFYRAFSHPSFIILLFFPTPPIKLKLGQQQQQIRGGGTTNSKTIWTKLLL